MLWKCNTMLSKCMWQQGFNVRQNDINSDVIEKSCIDSQKCFFPSSFPDWLTDCKNTLALSALHFHSSNSWRDEHFWSKMSKSNRFLTFKRWSTSISFLFSRQNSFRRKICRLKIPAHFFCYHFITTIWKTTLLCGSFMRWLSWCCCKKHKVFCEGWNTFQRLRRFQRLQLQLNKN